MSRLFWKLSLVIAASLATATVSLASGPEAVRRGSAPRLPSGARVLGSFPSTTRMLVTVALQPRDPAALASYATAVSTPGSSVYHHYLTVAEFRQRFAPTDAQISSVTSSLRAHGLNPGRVTANGLAIPLTADAGGIEHAFSVALNRVSLPSGRTAFANTAAPQLDGSIAGYVQGVVGLDDLAVPHRSTVRATNARPHAASHVLTGGPQPCSDASSAAAGNASYTSDQIASAYGFSGLYGAGDEGAGQTVAIYELEGNFQSDIGAFESCYGINTSVSYTPVDGGAPAPDPTAQDGLESELDIENTIGLAPRANVLVYQGPNSSSNLPGAGPYDLYNAIISQDRAQVISTSWGLCEPQDSPVPTAQQEENTLFQEAALQGETVVSASGDTGSQDCTNAFGNGVGGLAVGDPASQPFVTGVGGTSLASPSPPPSESVWENNSCTGLLGLPAACGGGGGISQQWQMPPYQSSAPSSLNVINSSSSGSPCGAPSGSVCREVPDVSADADPQTGYTIYYDGSWGSIGGTSGAAPVWAALMADANGSSACAGSRIGFANPGLYRAAAGAYGSDFNDVTTGNNNLSGSGPYPAGAGYDMASGLGTPNATNLASSLCSLAVHVKDPGNQTAVAGVPTRLGIAATDGTGEPLAYSAFGLPSGLSINSGTGVISGKTSSLGTHAVTVFAADKDGSLGSTSFAWSVIRPGKPTLSRGSLTGVGKDKPKLRFAITASANAPGVKKVVVLLPKGLSFSARKRNISTGISLIGGSGKLTGARLRLSGGHLTIILPKAVKKLRVLIKSPAIQASKRVVSTVKRHKAGKLKLSVKVTDASGRATALALRLKPS